MFTRTQKDSTPAEEPSLAVAGKDPSGDGLGRAQVQAPTARRRIRSLFVVVRHAGPRHVWRRRRLRTRYDRAVAEAFPGVLNAIWSDAARELGAELRPLSPTFLEIRRGAAAVRVTRRTVTPLTDLVSYDLTNDKPLVHRLLAEAGLPIPEHVVVDASDVESARAFLARVEPPLVVKPAEGTAGEGVVGHIRDLAELRRALRDSGRYGSRVLVERMIAGDTYRLLLLDGELLDAIRRLPAQVTGDGRSTVETLIFDESERRIAAGGDAHGFRPFEFDLDTLGYLVRAGYRLDSVLPAGESIRIKTASNVSGPAESAFDAVGAELIESARTAAQVLGIRVAGVDVVTTDPARSLSDTGGVVLEVNVPGLQHHYNVVGANAKRVAVPILEAALREAPERRGHVG
jgi:D-alanine-D-alanine ligase-like ATP-grasp enzyme